MPNRPWQDGVDADDRQKQAEAERRVRDTRAAHVEKVDRENAQAKDDK